MDSSITFGTVAQWVGIGIAFLVVVGIIFSNWFFVKTKTAYVIERGGRFNRIAHDGIKHKLPFIESKYLIDLAIDNIEFSMETKTKDNATVTLPLSVQYCVGPTDNNIKDYHYNLTDEDKQLRAFTRNVLLAHIPEKDLDDLFLSIAEVSERARVELEAQVLPKFGLQIIAVMITDVVPEDDVKAAMNRINEQKRLLEANKAQGEAEFVLKTRQAQADAEVKHQAGLGIAMERKAIADGLEEAIEKIKKGTGLSAAAAFSVLLANNYTDAIKEIGSSDNTTMILLPSGPDAAMNIQQTITNALLVKRDS